jgi:hypothetical protein
MQLRDSNHWMRKYDRLLPNAGLPRNPGFSGPVLSPCGLAATSRAMGS